MKSMRTAGSLGNIRTLFETGSTVGLPDDILLDNFATHRGAAEAAFAALVVRHGPMVQRVCRRLLRDPHDVDDAFQATFLVLARKAGAIQRRIGFRVGSSARRVASQRNSRPTPPDAVRMSLKSLSRRRVLRTTRTASRKPRLSSKRLLGCRNRAGRSWCSASWKA